MPGSMTGLPAGSYMNGGLASTGWLEKEGTLTYYSLFDTELDGW